MQEDVLPTDPNLLVDFILAADSELATLGISEAAYFAMSVADQSHCLRQARNTAVVRLCFDGCSGGCSVCMSVEIIA